LPGGPRRSARHARAPGATRTARRGPPARGLGPGGNDARGHRADGAALRGADAAERARLRRTAGRHRGACALRRARALERVRLLPGGGVAGRPRGTAGDRSRSRTHPTRAARRRGGAGARRRDPGAGAMRGRVLVVTAMAAALVLYLIRAAGGPDSSSAAPASVRTAAPGRAVAEPVATPSSPVRNVFEYAEASVRAAGPPPTARSVAPSVVSEPSLPVPPPPPPVRLVVLLRRGSHLKAA